MAFELLTKDEVAKRTHISRRYLERRIADGTGPETLVVGRRVLVRSDAFASWIEGLAQSQRQAAAVEVAPAAPAPASCEVAPA